MTQLGDRRVPEGSNRAWWDERVPLHLASAFYDIDGFRAHPDVLRGFETAEVGDVTGLRLLHLQCHFGQDTLSWAYRGATVTGLDFSAPAIEAARALARELDLPARFVVADVYDAPEALAGETFDVVYTGIGALNWLPDLAGWADTVARLLAPGGFLYLAEVHPIQGVLDDDTGNAFVLDYFDHGPHVWEEEGSYADPDAETDANVTVEYHHTLGAVVSAVVGAGLLLESLQEHDFTMTDRFDTLVQGDDGLYRFPPGAPRVPLLFTLRAAKP
ncbi:class I SAM-dependent methyltransferase [Frankia sp. CNm7]|uniref:Class I SAM-dependent methyltransferase n=1 Tax=Frankia nepalensis TaxID=1836974 RepID=A0A937RA84_9ACTN|nr:class I SAM-dependent methyltransferase [Frankia nepalensis]MBL7499891.1 class I SAM-dependent methyltransferase [Frankia nepalensis]MBL7512291.1 class I SAM-dependent methyltransferase [Frankia nepalensis]MBL7520948.1 class I SAM-dependent methyltransferase [Frankia nepalensis]MBL7628311.1 class I SAM-dependent methyltransferase [Frankia nepalensis]